MKKLFNANAFMMFVFVTFLAAIAYTAARIFFAPSAAPSSEIAVTMKDLIVDALGAFVMSSIGYVSLKYNRGWLERIQIKHK